MKETSYFYFAEINIVADPENRRQLEDSKCGEKSNKYSVEHQTD